MSHESFEKNEITDEQLVSVLKEKGEVTPEIRELLSQWIDQREEAIKAVQNTFEDEKQKSEASHRGGMETEYRLTKIFLEAGLLEIALDRLNDMDPNHQDVDVGRMARQTHDTEWEQKFEELAREIEQKMSEQEEKSE
jgi:hypothetical protein